MTESHQQSAGPEATAAARPAPNMMPRAVGAVASADAVSETEPSSVTATVGEILEQVDDIRRATGDAFDLVALGREAELLEHAHEVLTAALEDVDPR